MAGHPLQIETENKTAVPVNRDGGFLIPYSAKKFALLFPCLSYAIRRASGRIFPVVIGFLYGTLCGVN